MGNESRANQDDLLKWSEYYSMRGWPIIPATATKRPLVKWTDYQARLTETEEVEGWLRDLPAMTAIGTATGEFSGIVVIDVEAEGDPSPYLELDTPIARSGGGGWHIFLKHPGFPVRNSVKELAPYTDIRGDGGFLILAPSISEKGSYSWIKSPHDTDLAELPFHVLEFLKKDAHPTDWEQFANSDVLKGDRNNAATSYAGYLLAKHTPEDWDDVAFKKLSKWNTEHCKPALSHSELNGIFTSIKAREAAKPIAAVTQLREPRTSVATRLVQSLMQQPGIEFFHDQYGDAFVRVPVNGHEEVWPCDSREFRRYIAREFYVLTEGKETATNDAISTAINAIEGKAVFDGQEYKLSVRATRTEDGAIWYDLGDDSWRAVKVTKEGWQIQEKIPVLFRRYSHLDAQVDPVAGGRVEDVLKFVNITDPDQKILFLVYLVVAMIPGFPHPMPFVFGPQGSAKSSLSRILRKLIDPSKLDVVSLTRHEKDLLLQLAHQYFLFFDNVSDIPDWIADLLCRAITGAGVASRMLYTNSDEVIQNIRTNVGVNGINLSCSKPDLLERSILFELTRMDKSVRKNEDELYAEFEAERPMILGAMFDAVAKTLELRDSVKLPSLPRMADFAAYGYAAAEALGIGGQSFMDAYYRNINSQSSAVIDDNLVASLLRDIANVSVYWEGTADELLKKMKDMLLERQVADRELPPTASALSREVNKVSTPLLDEEVSVSHHPKQRRVIIIRKMDTGTDCASVADNEPCP